MTSKSAAACSSDEKDESASKLHTATSLEIMMTKVIGTKDN